MIELTVHGDFNCPFSASASDRVDGLDRRGLGVLARLAKLLDA